MKIKYITFEVSTKNIILTIVDNPLYPAKRGLNPTILADWEFIDQTPELIPWRDIAWSGMERPVGGK